MEIALERIRKNKLTRDTYLHLENCGIINELPVELADCHWLRSIFLSNWIDKKSSIKRNPMNVFSGIEDFSILHRLPLLDTLVMIDTGLIDIEFIKGFKRLTTISLSNNRFEDIEPLVAITGLRELYMNESRVVNFDPIKRLDKLQYLSLECNNIKDISFLKESKDLVELKLKENRIQDIHLLARLTNLEYLDVSYNFIKDLNGIQHLSKLESVYFGSNEVSSIQPVYGLSSLITLNMNNNRITSLDGRFLQFFPKLRILNIKGNKDIQIPASLVTELKRRVSFLDVDWEEPIPAAPPTPITTQPKPPVPVDNTLNFMPFVRILLWIIACAFIAGVSKNFELDYTLIGVAIGVVLGFGNEVRR